MIVFHIMKTERIAIRVDKATKKKLEKLADQNNRKYSDLARILLENALESALKSGFLSKNLVFAIIGSVSPFLY